MYCYQQVLGHNGNNNNTECVHLAFPTLNWSAVNSNTTCHSCLWIPTAEVNVMRHQFWKLPALQCLCMERLKKELDRKYPLNQRQHTKLACRCKVSAQRVRVAQIAPPGWNLPIELHWMELAEAGLYFLGTLEHLKTWIMSRLISIPPLVACNPLLTSWSGWAGCRPARRYGSRWQAPCPAGTPPGPCCPWCGTPPAGPSRGKHSLPSPGKAPERER